MSLESIGGGKMGMGIGMGMGMAYLTQAEIVFFVVIDVGQGVDRSRSSSGISSIHTTTHLKCKSAHGSILPHPPFQPRKDLRLTPFFFLPITKPCGLVIGFRRWIAPWLGVSSASAMALSMGSSSERLNGILEPE